MLNNPDFYPTPTSVVREMIEPFHDRLPTMQILEPSAGSGSMLDYVTSMYKPALKKNIYAIENDPELAFLLQGKGYRLIETDFLKYNGDYAFDLILMNPPFSDGASHLLKAWDTLRCGHIVCLLNQATIDNPHTEQRKYLNRIIEQFGSVKELGPAFETAERKTKIPVALVRLEKKVPDERFKLDLDFIKEADVDFSPETAGNEMALNDVTGTMLRQYDMTCQAMVQFIKAYNALQFYGKGFLKTGNGILNIADAAVAACKDEPTPGAAYNRFVNDCNGSAWNGILNKMEISKIFTYGVQEKLTQFRQAQGSMALTRANVISLVQMLVMNRVNIMDGAIIDVFDTFTKFHIDNRCHAEGWVTNDSWRVNRKVILPGFLRYPDRRFENHYYIGNDKYQQFEDIDKVMCWLTGLDYDDLTKYTSTYEYNKPENQNRRRLKSLRTEIEKVALGDTSEHESEFFTFRCYLKGTLHITFKDEKLWAEFNQRACKGKNWIPDTTKRKQRNK